MPLHHCTAMRNRESVRLWENTAEPDHPKIQGFPQDALNEQLNSSLFTHLDVPSLILRQSKQFCTFYFCQLLGIKFFHKRKNIYKA